MTTKSNTNTSTPTLPKYNFVDLFCGIGGFHQGLLKINPDNTCVLGCDIDKKARETYLKNYGEDTKFIDNIRTLTDYLFSSNEKIKEIEKQIKNRKNYLDKVSKSISNHLILQLFANIALVVAKQVKAGVKTISSFSLNPDQSNVSAFFFNNFNAKVKPDVAEFNVTI